VYTARHLLKDASLPRNAGHWNDQPSLAVAIYLMNQPYDILDERYNFPAHLRPLKNEQPFFCHYHWPNVIRREPRLNAFVQDLASEREDLANILRRDPAWAALLEPYEVRPRATLRKNDSPFEGPELAITGMPGCGMDLLAKHLRRFGNVVVVDEPPAVDTYLRDEVVPSHVATFFRDVRSEALDGAAGAEVEAADFAVAVKHRGFLEKLDVLAGKVLPDARIVACIRNPLDAIAAWKREGVPGAGASLWRSYAEILLRNRERLLLVRYEDLVADPRRVMSRIFRGTHPGAQRAPPEAAAAESRRERLDAREVEDIRATCAEAAAALGVPLA
jgi:hypothetical protein